jgi:hypothetical protein
MSKDKYKVPKTIAVRNKWFAALAPNEKRVAIAMDVIAQIEVRKYSANTGSYFTMNISKDDVKYKSMQKLIENAPEICQVCAIGAAFASRVRLGNECGIDVLDKYAYTATVQYTNNINLLSGIFEEYTLKEMELFFEGYDVNLHFCGEEDIVIAADNFYDRNVNSNKRLIKIMQNIISNHGKFVWKELI